MPGIKPKSGRQQSPGRKVPGTPAPRFRPPAHPRTLAGGHVLDACLQCGTGLSGGWTTADPGGDRPASGSGQVTEQSSGRQRLAQCVRNVLPKVDLGGVCLGKQRLPASKLLSPGGCGKRGLAALPFRPVVSRPPVAPEPRTPSSGAIHQVARQANRPRTGLLERIRVSPGISRRTSWRQDDPMATLGLSASHRAVFPAARPPGKETGGRACWMSPSVVSHWSDAMPAYHHYPGLKQGCWGTCSGTSTT